MPQGTVKEFDAGQRSGVLLLEDRTEVHVDAASVEASEIRSLRIGQRVRFDIVEEGGRKLARSLHLVTFA